MPNRLTTRLLLTLAILAPLTAPPASAQPRQRTETVAGWRITSGPSGDGGHEVHLTRRGRGYVYDRMLDYWHANNGVSMLGEFRRGRCVGLGESGIVPFWHATSRARMEQELTANLRDCPLPAAEAAALRRSLARAWPVYMRHIRRQRAMMDADSRAIENYGR